MTRLDMIRLALAYDADDLDVRTQVALLLADQDAFGRGCATALLRGGARLRSRKRGQA